MTTVLTHVISSSSLPNIPIAEGKDCPREYLGLTCVKEHYECLCQLAESFDVKWTHDDEGAPVSMVMTFQLTPGVHQPQRIFPAVELTGYVADFEASHLEVAATFNLNKPVNRSLKQ